MMLIGLCMLLVLTFDSVRTKLPYPFLLDAFPLEKNSWENLDSFMVFHFLRCCTFFLTLCDHEAIFIKTL